MSFRIEHRLGVPASAAVVWDILKDVEGWPQWSALYADVSGNLRIGGQLVVTEQIPRAVPQILTATIVDWVPEAQILWKTKSSKGLIKRTRYIEIEKLSDTGCVFSNGEIYEGLMTRYVSRPHRRNIRDAFAAFGEALKAQVIAKVGAPAEAGR